MNLKNLLIFKCLEKNALLIRELSSRRIKEKYKGTLLGLTWIVGQPLFMLSVYTFVFTTVFKSRWAGMETGGELAYALNMFIGLIVFNLFNESMCSAAGIIRSNPNFVKKVIFPLEVLGISIVTGAVAQAIVSIGVFCAVALLGLGYIPWTVIFLPIVIFPMVVACLALSWLMSGIGVFFKDIDQILPVVSSALMFGSAVFYPLEVLPSNVRGIFELNLIVLL